MTTPAVFQRAMIAGWGDMDFNAHMRNTAFLDKAADVRFMFFAGQGFGVDEFMRLRIGPVVRRDELEYFREVRLLEEFHVRLESAGLSEDGSRFILRNTFLRADDTIVARVTSSGGWLDLSARRLIVPPEGLRAALLAMSRTDDFQVLPPLGRG
jgi:acyl-CoA thioester hydrolase